MDHCVGRILQAMEDSGQADNTVVFFTSDNGGTRSGRNAPFSGYKGSTYEGGIRVPAIVRWPGVIPEGIESDQLCMTFDLTASMARIAGASQSPEHPFDGIDLAETYDALRSRLAVGSLCDFRYE